MSEVLAFPLAKRSGDAAGGKKLEGLGLKMVRQLSNGEIANQKVRYQMGSIKILVESSPYSKAHHIPGSFKMTLDPNNGHHFQE